MSDLTAANCGCGCENNCNSGCNPGISLFNNGGCGCSILWIIILLCICGNNGCGQSNCMFEGGNSCLLILLLLFCCNNNECGC